MEAARSLEECRSTIGPSPWQPAKGVFRHLLGCAISVKCRIEPKTDNVGPVYHRLNKNFNDKPGVGEVEGEEGEAVEDILESPVETMERSVLAEDPDLPLELLRTQGPKCQDLTEN